MTAHNDDRLLSAWLHDTAPAREPEHLLGEVLARTARTRRRAAWRNLERFDLMSAISARFAPATPVPWRLIAVAAALLLAVAAGIALLSSGSIRHPAPPYGLAANGGVVYSRSGEIVVADSPTSAPRPLVAGSTGFDEVPIFSPDGTRLSFFRGPDGATGVWVANADGSDAHEIAGPWPGFPASVDWSPQGDLLVMNSMDPDGTGLVLVRTDGSGTSTIATPGLVNVDFPQFRPPAGGQITFRALDAQNDFGFYIVNRDGSGLRQLRLDAGFQQDDYYDENREFYFDDLTWNSAGTQIAFHTLEPAPDSVAGPGFRIHIAGVDGAGTVTTERILEFDPERDDEFSPIFLPGTDDILFRTIEGETSSLFRGSAVPGGTATSLGISAPDWLTVTLAPDGKTAIVVVPDGPPGNRQTRHVDLLDLATLTTTLLGIPEDFSWQRVGD
jgi:hypothetical protein